jgi:hypothetical protein
MKTGFFHFTQVSEHGDGSIPDSTLQDEVHHVVVFRNTKTVDRVEVPLDSVSKTLDHIAMLLADLASRHERPRRRGESECTASGACRNIQRRNQDLFHEPGRAQGFQPRRTTLSS